MSQEVKRDESGAIPALSNSPSKTEVRSFRTTVELRASADGTGPGVCVGLAAVFNSYSEDLGWFREKIAPGAFADCLARDDVRALFNHDVNMLLGRSTSGTLRLKETNEGLGIEVDLPDTTVGRDVAVYLGRRDVTGMSFSFDMEDGIEEWDYSGSTYLRTLIKVGRLYDVGPVVFPAYTNTSAAMRSMERHRPKPDNSLWLARASLLSL